jgi:hypothetical protein
MTVTVTWPNWYQRTPHWEAVVVVTLLIRYAGAAGVDEPETGWLQRSDSVVFFYTVGIDGCHGAILTHRNSSRAYAGRSPPHLALRRITRRKPQHRGLPAATSSTLDVVPVDAPLGRLYDAGIPNPRDFGIEVLKNG